MPLLTVTALAEAGAAASFDVAAIMQAAVTSVQADMFKVLGIAATRCCHHYRCRCCCQIWYQMAESLKSA